MLDGRNGIKLGITRILDAKKTIPEALALLVETVGHTRQQFVQVRRAGIGNGTAIDAGIERGTRKGCIPAIARAENADALGVDHAFVGKRPHAIGEIGLHLLAELSETGPKKILAETAGATKLRLQNRITPRGDRLRYPVKPRTVARLRPAMGQDNERQVLRRAAGWQREI